MERDVQLGQKQPDGATLREHLLAAWRQGAPMDDRLRQSIPVAGESLWKAFAQLSRARSVGFSGPAPLGHHDVLAWCELHGVRLTAWEIDAMFAMYNAFLAAVDQGAAS